MNNEKKYREGQVCTGQTSGVEITTAHMNHVATPAATAPATTENTETSTMAAPSSEAATVVTAPTTTAVAFPTSSEQCIPGGTNTTAATTVPNEADHIHATAASKRIPAAAVGTTNRRMKERGDRKI